MRMFGFFAWAKRLADETARANALMIRERSHRGRGIGFTGFILHFGFG